jgi:hypothetical protein
MPHHARAIQHLRLATVQRCPVRRIGGKRRCLQALRELRWLAPTRPLVPALGAVLYGLNWLAMHLLFWLRVTGSENLPASGPFVLASNMSATSTRCRSPLP